MKAAVIALFSLLAIPAGAAPRVHHPRTRHEVIINSSQGDITGYDDPIIRAAAIKALSHFSGSVVAIDPNTGRILTIVNQRLVFSTGFIPCSTIKPYVALTALDEGVINSDTMIQVARHKWLNLTEALAHSNNEFFEELGRRLGFETLSSHERTLGLGELSGYHIPEEHSGGYPTEPPKNGGVARMSSFGEGIQMTPLQLGALVSSIANGGTLYYLQYPRTLEDIQNFAPRIKRDLKIEAFLPEVRDGMLAAVLYGTARRGYISGEETELGKTGTCSEDGSRLGWFASYIGQANPKLVLVVLIRGHKGTIRGAMAASVAGQIYRALNEENYFNNNRY